MPAIGQATGLSQGTRPLATASNLPCLGTEAGQTSPITQTHNVGQPTVGLDAKDIPGLVTKRHEVHGLRMRDVTAPRSEHSLQQNGEAPAMDFIEATITEQSIDLSTGPQTPFLFFIFILFHALHLSLIRHKRYRTEHYSADRPPIPTKYSFLGTGLCRSVLLLWPSHFV